jgi:hypothetical protein
VCRQLTGRQDRFYRRLGDIDIDGDADVCIPADQGGLRLTTAEAERLGAAAEGGSSMRRRHAPESPAPTGWFAMTATARS